VKKIILILLTFFELNCQNISLNNDYIYSELRTLSIDGTLKTNFSFNIKPINIENIKDYQSIKFKNLLGNKSKKITLKFLSIDYLTEFNMNHPYNRNNGSMIPNRGFQHILSPGIFMKIGPLSIKIKPEHLYAENKNFDGFWVGHAPEIWAKRYLLWNRIDMPERFGDKRHNKILLGQSNIKFNWKNFSIGLSNENIWWGPSIRNSIMMSNHAQGFKHISFKTSKPIKSLIGDFEWEFITGRLESSGFKPPNTDFEYAGTKLYVPKINQMGSTDDWRYLQGYIISYSPKWINGLSIGFIRWVNMYSALVEGKYTWMKGSPTYFPVFSNLFRKNDNSVDFEAQTDQAAGFFFKWIWKDAKSEIYAEFHYNDAKQNFRDLLLDTDHSRARTLGFQKIFKINNSDILINWEWTQMEQNASRLIRSAGSWYEHSFVYDGYTNNGEVLGSSIGPGSNSQFFSISKLEKKQKISLAFELIDNDNDFYHEAFISARDYRRYWKDFNFHLNYHKKFDKILLSSGLIFSRSLNYQWELIEEKNTPYYKPGRDVNNLHINIKISYLIF
tara:strand:+ start:1327 stop:3000 length:1674 start_codon:yes stop_codon:yes gene_type:complete